MGPSSGVGCHRNLDVSKVWIRSHRLVVTTFFFSELRRPNNYSWILNVCKAIVSFVPVVLFTEFSPYSLATNGIWLFVKIKFSLSMRPFFGRTFSFFCLLDGSKVRDVSSDLSLTVLELFSWQAPPFSLLTVVKFEHF